MFEDFRQWIGRFKQRKMKDDHSWMWRQLSSTCFVLAGFSFTSLSLVVGFRWQLGMAGTMMISILLVCSILFLIGGEFARETHNVWEYVLAESLYLISTGLVLAMFLWLGWVLLGVHPVAIAAIVAAIGFFFAKAIHGMQVVYRTNPPPAST